MLEDGCLAIEFIVSFYYRLLDHLLYKVEKIVTTSNQHVFYRFSTCVCMEQLISDECAYNVIFQNIEPDNNQKLQVRNSFLIYYCVQFSNLGIES